MNKYLFLICCFYFSTFHLEINAQEVRTSADMDLKGKVWRIDTYRHVADSVQVKDNAVSYKKLQLLNHTQFLFSKDGLMQAENRFSLDEDIIELSFIYMFDEQNRLIDVTRATFGKFLAGMTEYQYDKEGKKIKGLVYDHQDSLQNIINYTYDFSGSLIRETTHNMSHRKIKELIYQYDEKGNCISVQNVKTSARANKPYREVQKFDERNNLIYKSFYDENDSLKWEYFAEYNLQDSLYYEEVKDKNGITTHRSDLKYNKYHNRISLKLYSKKNDEIREMYSRYKYDKQQRLLLEEKFLSGEKKPFLTKKYFYDTQNNWIFCIEENKQTGRIIVHSRRIEYY
jgi:hypothetical protein